MFKLFKNLMFLFLLVLINPASAVLTDINGDLTPEEAEQLLIQQSLEEQDSCFQREQEEIAKALAISIAKNQKEQQKRKFGDLDEKTALEIALLESQNSQPKILETTQTTTTNTIPSTNPYYVEQEPTAPSPEEDKNTEDTNTVTSNSTGIFLSNTSKLVGTAFSYLNPFSYFTKDTPQNIENVETIVNFSLLDSNHCIQQPNGTDCGFYAILNTLKLANMNISFNQESLYPQVDDDYTYLNSDTTNAINRMKKVPGISTDNLHSGDIEKIIQNVNIVGLNNLNIVVMDFNDFIINEKTTRLTQFKNATNPEPMFVILNTNPDNNMHNSVGHWIAIKVEKNGNNINLTIADSSHGEKTPESYQQNGMIGGLLAYLG
ncbi:MAG: hypothetical protein ABIA74_06110 [bacterium]